MEQQPAPVTLAVTNEMIDQAKHPRQLVDLPAVADNWIRTYNRCHARTDGELRYEREKILFVQAITANTALSNTLPFTRYAALMRMAMSGVSLDDGEASLIPRGKVCTLHIQWKGRRAQIASLPHVQHVDEPVVVYDCDCDPQYTSAPYNPIRGMNGLILNDWQRAANRPESAKPLHVYVLVSYNYGIKAYAMDRTDVLAIRDEYSDSYKQYLADLKANEASKATAQPWPDGKVWKTKYQSNEGYWADIKVPMWVNREEEAWKKTMIHRLWKSVDKLPHHKYVDEQIAKELLSIGTPGNPYDDPTEFEFSPDFVGVPGKQTKPRKTQQTGGGSAAPDPAGTQVGAPPHNPAVPPVPQPEPPVQQPQPQPQTQPAQPATQAPVPPPPTAQPVWDAAIGQWVVPGQAPTPPPAERPDHSQPGFNAEPQGAGMGLGNLNEPF